MKHNTRRAFTLVELMVVIAVVALLVAMLLPSFSKVVEVAHQSQCAGNLEHLGQAFSTIGANVNISSSGALQPMGWRGQIQEYIAHDQVVMICPNGYNKGVTEQALGAFALRTYGDTGGTNFLYDMPFIEGPCTRKENVRNGGMSFDLSFEDQRTSSGLQEASFSDHSFANPIMSVDFVGNDIKIGVKSGGGGYRWDLVDPYKKVLMISVMKITMAGASYTLSGVGTPFSYGLNSMATTIKPSSDRIMALDYPAEVVRVAGADDVKDNWLTWTDEAGKYTFARHFDRCNVLLADGRVIRLSPEQMDPTNPTLLSKYWKP